MEHQNITLSIRKDLLRKVKHIAIERQTSVSGLLAGMLEELAQKGDLYSRSRARHIGMLDNAFDLGTHGKTAWRREDVHER